MVRGDGIIVGTCADNNWAMHALGVDPTKIIHQSMAQYIDVFADVGRALPTGRLTPTLVSGMQQSLCDLTHFRRTRAVATWGCVGP